jgi:hypothetical protein
LMHELQRLDEQPLAPRPYLDPQAAAWRHELRQPRVSPRNGERDAPKAQKAEVRSAAPTPPPRVGLRQRYATLHNRLIRVHSVRARTCCLARRPFSPASP